MIDFDRHVEEWKALAMRAHECSQEIPEVESDAKEWVRLEVQSLRGSEKPDGKQHSETSAEKQVKASEKYKNFKQRIHRLRGEQGECAIDAEARKMKLWNHVYTAKVLKA